MALKNVTRIPALHHGLKSFSLIDDSGDKVASYEYFAKHLARKGSPWSTRNAYLSAVAKFIDYLYEAGVFASGGISKAKLNAVVEQYTTVLARGKEYDWVRYAADSKEDGIVAQDFDWLPAVVAALDIPAKGLRPNSFDNRIAGINLYLHLCEAFRDEMLEKANHLGLHDIPPRIEALLNAVDGYTLFSDKEKKQLRNASVLGAVIRFHSNGLSRPAGLKNIVASPRVLDAARLDFPIGNIESLLDACHSHRDRCLWLLLLGTGIRSSEAKNLRWGEIDISNQKIWVSDPHKLRYGDQMTPEEYRRFKGRTYSMTYFIKPIREEFFRQLELYLAREYTGSTNDEDYVFQFLREFRRWGIKRGDPLVTISDEGFIGLFRRAVKRAGVPVPQHLPGFEWTPHSLRHAYGVYMRNYFPTGEMIRDKNGVWEEKRGLLTEEVQKLMGHDSIRTTEYYAREKRDKLITKLERADRWMFGCDGTPLSDMPAIEVFDDTTLLPKSIVARISSDAPKKGRQ